MQGIQHVVAQKSVCFKNDIVSCITFPCAKCTTYDLFKDPGSFEMELAYDLWQSEICDSRYVLNAETAERPNCLRHILFYEMICKRAANIYPSVSAAFTWLIFQILTKNILLSVKIGYMFYRCRFSAVLNIILELTMAKHGNSGCVILALVGFYSKYLPTIWKMESIIPPRESICVNFLFIIITYFVKQIMPMIISNRTHSCYSFMK